MATFAEFARKTEQINQQTVAIRRLRLEMQEEREQWEADAEAIAEYESWNLHKTILEAGK